MKPKSKKLIKAMLVSAIFSILPANSEAKEISPVYLDDDKDDLLNTLKAPVWHSVMKVCSNGNLTSVESHRSHSSHRSHRSSRSGYGSHYSSSHSSRYSSTVTTKSTPSSSVSSFYSSPSKNYNTYSLGDRILSQGMYGKDVDVLVCLLKDFHYIRSTYSMQKNGYFLYTAEVVQGIKFFQKDAGIPITGIFDSKTKNALDCWSSAKTIYRLGVRELDLNTVGDDVQELISLLTKVGYAPNPETTKTDTKIFTQDVADAIKVFQAFCGLSVTGKANYDTIDKLKSIVK